MSVMPNTAGKTHSPILTCYGAVGSHSHIPAAASRLTILADTSGRNQKPETRNQKPETRNQKNFENCVTFVKPPVGYSSNSKYQKNIIN